MQLNDWDLEFQKIIKGVEVLSKIFFIQIIN